MSNPHQLESNAIDRLTAEAKALASLCPVAGGIIGEVLGCIIPGQRIERMTAFLRLLDAKIASLENAAAAARLKDAGRVDLFEDAMFAASRTRSEERLQYLAAIVGNSLTPEHIDADRQRKLLWILNQVNDSEVIMLRYHAFGHALGETAASEYRERHEGILTTRPLYSGLTEEEYAAAQESNAFHDVHLAHLTELRLVRPRFSKPGRNELPEFDSSTGMMKASRHEITALGRLLLREIDLVREEAPPAGA